MSDQFKSLRPSTALSAAQEQKSVSDPALIAQLDKLSREKLPPLPPGYTLDAQKPAYVSDAATLARLNDPNDKGDDALPPLPPGYTLDKPAPRATTRHDQLARDMTVSPQHDRAELDAEQRSGNWSPWLKGMARSVANGVTLNFADEIEAGIKTGFFGRDYERAKAQILDEMESFKRVNPKSALASEITGAVAVPGMAGIKAVGTLAKGAGLGRTAAASAVVGGVEGGVSAAGKNFESDKLAGDMARGAVVGATIGGVVPAAAAGVSSAAKYGYEKIASRIPGAIGDRVAATRADKAVAEAIEADAQVAGRSTADEFARLRAPGNVAAESRLVNHLGENANALAAEAQKNGGAATLKVFNDAIEQTAQSRPAKAAYDAMHALPAVRDTALDKFLMQSPTAREAWKAGITAARDAGERVRANIHTPRTMDYADRHLTDAIQSAKSAGHTNRMGQLVEVQNKLRGMIDTRLPELRALREQYAEGSALLRTMPDKQTKVTAERTNVVADAAEVGRRAALGSRLGLAPSINRLLDGGSERTAQKIAERMVTMYGNKAEVERVLKALEKRTVAERRKFFSTWLAIPASEMAGARAAHER